ncbi:hypothetical protein P885DRAFT_40533 [Corynascus similis CBS 632.67]
MDAIPNHGLSNLHMAVILGQECRVLSVLREYKGKEAIDAGDVDGTTPLMAAVLVGNVSIFCLLLQAGASPNARDDQGREALAYARVAWFREKLNLFHRLGVPIDPGEQRRGQYRISVILRHPVAVESWRRSGQHSCSQMRFWKDGGTLETVKPSASYKVVTDNLKRATAGIIVPATQSEVKTAAASGWQTNESRGHNVLDNSKYIALVYHFASILGFSLPSSPRDNNGPSLQEHAGRYYACHAEKKLAMFWIIASLKAVLNTTDLERAHELKGAEIPKAWKLAWIFLDNDPCPNVRDSCTPVSNDSMTN